MNTVCDNPGLEEPQVTLSITFLAAYVFYFLRVYDTLSSDDGH